MAEDPIPFAEGAPPDNLQVEDFGDDVLIGDPMLDVVEEEPTEFDANLAITIDQSDLDKKASALISDYNSDKEARKDWEERYKKGLEVLTLFNLLHI